MNSRNQLPADPKTKGYTRSRRFPDFLAVGVMLMAVAALYRPWLVLGGTHTLFGFDYLQLHTHRLSYAREALLGPHPFLPAWYSRELLGTPFWSNMQSFPFIPTRLLLLLVDPLQAYALGVNLAAGLAALFTYLYCRRVGLAPLPAATSGWTFAASGFFAARTMAGHLPLLEAYPALPLLLWLIEINLREPSSSRGCNLPLLALSVATGCVVMAGHPQLPIYALATAILYLLYQARDTRALKPLGAMVLGVGLAGFVLWPMFQLVRRSTRLLSLDAPQNDISFPYARLASYLFPWKDGFPDPFSGNPLFAHYPNTAYFWDTVCYVGWLPLLALIFLILRGKGRQRPWPFFIVLGSLALILALPLTQSLRSSIPGTILRSPSRQIYLTTFTLALALGGALDSWLRNPPPKARTWVVGAAFLALVVHAWDLGGHDLRFIRALPAASFRVHSVNETWLTQISNGRIAMDSAIASPLNREIDDIGFFDSVILARPYRALIDLTDKPPTLNIQKLDGSQMSARALAATATKLVVTSQELDDLPRLDAKGTVHVYAVPLAVSRASFLRSSQAVFLNEAKIHERLRDPSVNLTELIMLPPNADKPTPPPPATPDFDGAVTYDRPSSDVIVLKVRTNQAGFLRVLESFDPGWTANVDGAPVPILPADDFALAVRLDPGIHQVRLRYATPGARTGAAISLVSLLLLVPLLVSRRSQPLCG
ncbi:MAG TPA: YfhO family protein [Verrucomicrobiae bacterium]|nr:YfhO family protein [Verrucomicrobiae bacterium]